MVFVLFVFSYLVFSFAEKQVRGSQANEKIKHIGILRNQPSLIDSLGVPTFHSNSTSNCIFTGLSCFIFSSTFISSVTLSGIVSSTFSSPWTSLTTPVSIFWAISFRNSTTSDRVFFSSDFKITLFQSENFPYKLPNSYKNIFWTSSWFRSLLYYAY